MVTVQPITLPSEGVITSRCVYIVGRGLGKFSQGDEGRKKGIQGRQKNTDKKMIKTWDQGKKELTPLGMLLCFGTI